MPAFALERLPNRDSLSYGNLYGIDKEASTIFRATLRYEGFSEIMAVLGEFGFFNMDPLLPLNAANEPSSNFTYRAVLEHLLSQLPDIPTKFMTTSGANTVSTTWITTKLAGLSCCKNSSVALRAANCIR